jgi:tetratricopeptide (TPR) repeat protein
MNGFFSRADEGKAHRFHWGWILLVVFGGFLLAVQFVGMSQFREGVQPILEWVGQALVVAWTFISTEGPLVLVTLAFVAYFPLAVFAYAKYQAPTRIRQLEKDFRLLFGDKFGAPENEFRLSLSRGNFGWHVALAMFITFIGTWLLLKEPKSFQPFATEPTVQAMRYGFLGAYLFSAQLIYRRYTTRDLQPAVFMYCSLTLIAGFIFNYVAFETVIDVTGPSQNQVTGVTAGISAIVAFSLGYFPALAITWFNKLAFAGLGVTERHKNEKALSLIEGISQFHETRLRDSGIDNVQNLATADIRALLLNTTFSAQEVIDWIDQAILLVYLDEKSIVHFRQSGIRALSDFLSTWEKIQSLPTDENGLTEFSQEVKTNPTKLKILADVMAIGPNVHYVGRYWSEVHKLTEQRRQILTEQHRIEMKRSFQRLGESQFRGDSRDQTLDPEMRDFLKEARYRGEEGEKLLETSDELFGLAFGLQITQKYSKAYEVYRRILELEPENIAALSNLAFVSLSIPDTPTDDIENLADRGLEIASRIDKVHPENFALLYQTKAETRLRRDDIDSALINLKLASALDNLSEYSKQLVDDKINKLTRPIEDQNDTMTTFTDTAVDNDKVKPE